MLKKLFTLGVVVCLASATAIAQETATSSFGVELGGRNGMYYERVLSPRFSVTGRAGLSLGLGTASTSHKLSFSGLTPYVEVAPRYYFSGASETATYHTGGYVALRGGVQLDKWTLFPPTKSKHLYHNATFEPAATYWTAPTVGWIFGIGQTSYLGLSLGVGFTWTRYTAGDETLWSRSSQGSKFPLLIGFNYGFSL